MQLCDTVFLWFNSLSFQEIWALVQKYPSLLHCLIRTSCWLKLVGLRCVNHTTNHAIWICILRKAPKKNTGTVCAFCCRFSRNQGVGNVTDAVVVQAAMCTFVTTSEKSVGLFIVNTCWWWQQQWRGGRDATEHGNLDHSGLAVWCPCFWSCHFGNL